MPESSPRAGNRAWGWLAGVVLLVFLVVIALAMWSEREDAQHIPGEVERRGEETWAPEPLDSPAAPAAADTAPLPGGR